MIKLNQMCIVGVGTLLVNRIEDILLEGIASSLLVIFLTTAVPLLLSCQ